MLCQPSYTLVESLEKTFCDLDPGLIGIPTVLLSEIQLRAFSDANLHAHC